MAFFFWLLLSLALIPSRPFGVELEELGLEKSGTALLEVSDLGRSRIALLKASSLVDGSDNISFYYSLTVTYY